MEKLNLTAQNISNTSIEGGVGPGVFLSICFTVGVPGNVAVMVYLRRNNQLSSLSRGLMMNLAVSDLLCLLTLPAWIYNFFWGWKTEVVLCKLMGFLLYCSIFSSLMTVTLLSVQRYLQVALPQRIRKLGLAGQRALLAAIWVFAAAWGSSYLVFRQVKQGVVHSTVCTIAYSSESQELSVLLTEVILGFLAPFLVMTFAYICLHQRVNQSVFFHSPRMARLITSIIVTFVLLWTPYQLVNILGITAIFLKHKSLYMFYYKFRFIAGALTLLNSTMNPFLYAFATRNRRGETVSNKTHDSNTTRDSSAPI